MPKTPLFLAVGIFIVAVWAVPATALTTVPPFSVVLFRKNLISFFRKVIVPFLQGYVFLHVE